MNQTDDTHDRIGRDVWRIAFAVIFGSFMSIIDMTIVNVALEELSHDLNASGFDQIQWIMTAYMLAVASVIPITGWLSDRVGGRRLFLLSISLFTFSSMLCALAWNLWSLVGFRVLQGIAGGALMPAGQILLAKAAGPQRMGRVMAIIGVPILMAPVLGPVLGGIILDSLPWEWIFLVNLPVGIIGYFVAAKLLPKVSSDPIPPRRALDIKGLTYASIGAPLIVYGLANVTAHGLFDRYSGLPILLGVALIIGFVRHALRHPNPLLDLSLFRSKAFAIAALNTFLLGAFLFGSLVLLPLYFQVARDESVLSTGLLLAPQGVGSAIGMALTGRIVDRIGGGIVTAAGLVLITIGTIPFVLLETNSSYHVLVAALVVRGVGFGSAMMPTMAAAFATLSREQVAHATPQLNVLQRIGGSLGTAILATILEHELRAAPKSEKPLPDALADAFSYTFWWVLVASAAIMLPTLLLAKEERLARRRKRLSNNLT